MVGKKVVGWGGPGLFLDLGIKTQAHADTALLRVPEIAPLP
jgi:hypothetical protein